MGPCWERPQATCLGGGKETGVDNRGPKAPANICVGNSAQFALMGAALAYPGGWHGLKKCTDLPQLWSPSPPNSHLSKSTSKDKGVKEPQKTESSDGPVRKAWGGGARKEEGSKHKRREEEF